MQTLSIKEILCLTPGSPVIATAGKIVSVKEFEKGSGEAGPWTLQDIFIEDATGEINVRISNHEEIPIGAIGAVRVFAAHQKAKGGLSGLKIEEEEFQETPDGPITKYKLLAVSRTGEIMTEEEWAKRNPVIPEKAKGQTQTAPPMQGQNLPQDIPARDVAPPATTTMRITELRYERTVNTGNYCSEKMGVTIALEPGTKGDVAVEAAKKFLGKHLPEEVIPAGAKAR